MYIGTYYLVIVKEYSQASNINVLIGKDMHRQLKELVYNTNKQKLERDLLTLLN